MKNMGDGRRVARVEREVQAVVSTFIIQRLQRELPGLITVSRVQIPADLRVARVYVSLLQTNMDEGGVDITPKVDLLKQAVAVLQNWAPEIQDEIGDKLKMKYLPKLTFFPDESTEKILKVEKIISNLESSKSSSYESGGSLGVVGETDDDDDDE